MFYSPEYNVAVYDVAAPEIILSQFKDAKQISPSQVAIPCTLMNLQTLNALGIPTPRILDSVYEWPRSPALLEPFEPQRAMADFLIKHKRGFVLSAPRTGKTLSCLWACDYIMRQYETKGARIRALIIAPLNNLKDPWHSSVRVHLLGKRTGVILHGSTTSRTALLEHDADFYIVNYDGLDQNTQLFKEISKRDDIQLVFVDESTAYKHATTDRHRALSKLVKHREYLWLATGTPTCQGAIDAYGQARLVHNGYKESFASYKRRIMHQLTSFKWEYKEGAAEEATKLLSPNIRFPQEACFEATDLSIIDLDVEMSQEQRAQYKEMRKELIIRMQSGAVISAANQGVMRLKLLQIACGAIYEKTLDGKDLGKVSHYLDYTPRINALHKLINEAPHKIIIFAPLTSVVDRLHKELSDNYGCVLVNGELDRKTKEMRLQRFTVGDARVLIAHPGPVSRGLDLTAATTIIWYAPTTKTEEYLQANERINGINQIHPRTIIRMSSSSVEREMYNRLADNESMQGAILKLIEKE